MIASQPMPQAKYDYRSNVIERVCTKSSVQNNNDSHLSLSFSMAVTMHDHITSPVAFGNYMHLFLIISDVGK